MKRISFIIVGLLLSLRTVAVAQPIEVTPSTMPLTLPDAIRLAIQNNLTIKLAHAETDEARGQAMQAAAALLPQVIGTASQTRVFKVNLEAEGFPANLGFFPSLIGPFNSFDARFRLSQNFINVNAWRKMEVGRAQRKAAEFQERLAREQVAAAAALAYLEAQRSTRAVAANQADLNLATSLLKLAQDQKQAGLSTGIDVARAETNAAQEHLRLIRAQVAVDQSDLALKRVAGIPLDVPLQLSTTTAPSDEIVLPAAREAIVQALQGRAEILLARERLESDRLALQASRAEDYPVLMGSADYGYSGTTPNNVARTGSIGGSLNLPIFGGGATLGSITKSKARASEAESRYNDTLIQVEEDARLARLTLLAELDEVSTANQAVQLAQKELTMARDRFGAGVGDNIQLLTAEDATDRALDDQVNAVARFDTARVNFASALGQAEQFR